MNDTITANQVQRLSDALEVIKREIDLLGTQVAATSPYSVVIGALREQHRALDMSTHRLHTHLAVLEAPALDRAEALAELQQQYPDGVTRSPDA